MFKNNKYMWIFETPIEDWIKFIKNKFGGSKYVVKGKCRQCGNCCRNILFSDENGYIKTEEQFEKIKKINRRYNHFVINGKMENGALLFKCKSLNDKTNKCKDYFFRSLFCRDYPSPNPIFISNGGTTLDGCGYYFDVNKKFSEYLK